MDALDEQGIQPELINGHPNPVEALYSDAGMDKKLSAAMSGGAGLDGMGIMSYAWEDSMQWFDRYDYYAEPDIIKFVVPEGYRLPLAIDTKIGASFCSDGYCDRRYRARLRAMVTKMPGFFMSAYQSIAVVPSAIVTSEVQYKYLMDWHQYGIDHAAEEMERL